MKTYISRATKWLALLSAISTGLLAAGITLSALDLRNVPLQILLIMGGGLMSILFVSCYFAEKSRALVMDSEKILFPRGVLRNGKMVFRKLAVRWEEIRAVESNLQRGDGIVAKSCYFHTLKLKDGTVLTVTLFAYGSEAEKEILETIRAHI